jgi:hypothetical protein
MVGPCVGWKAGVSCERENVTPKESAVFHREKRWQRAVR